MASVSASHLILFIASLVVAAGVAGTTINGGQRVAQALEAAGEDQSDELNAEIKIITDSGGPVYDRDGQGNITLHVANSGLRPLEPSSDMVDVLVNGSYIGDIAVTPLDGSTWGEDEVVRIEISADLGSGDHRVKIIAESSTDIFIFHI